MPQPNLFSIFDFLKFYFGQISQVFEGGTLGVDLLSFIKRLALFISIVFGALFIFLIIKLRKFISEQIRTLEIVPPLPDEGGAFMARWEEIKRHIDSGKEAQWKLAIIEADALVDGILEKAGYQGETMGEKLSLITKDQIQSLDGLWFAHKMRNQIVHDPEFKASQSDAIEAVGKFEQVLKELQVLQP